MEILQAIQKDRFMVRSSLETSCAMGEADYISQFLFHIIYQSTTHHVPLIVKKLKNLLKDFCGALKFEKYLQSSSARLQNVKQTKNHIENHLNGQSH